MTYAWFSMARARGSGEKALDRALALGLAHPDLVGFVPADEIEVLGQRREARAGRRRRGNQPVGRLEVRHHLGRRDHLQRGDSRARHGYLLSGTTSSLSRMALTPILATFGSSQVPLIE